MQRGLGSKGLAGAAAVASMLWIPAPVDAQMPAAEEQIAGAVLPLPEPERPTATVLGYRAAGDLVTLRRGAGNQVCIADAPGDDTYHVACYHDSLEPFMKRGRELLAQGIDDPARDSVRSAEAEAGTLPMPDHPAALVSLTGEASDWDPATRALEGARRLHVVYVPWATTAETGLPPEPSVPGQPWLMFPGSYRAHIMIVPPPAGGGG